MLYFDIAYTVFFVIFLTLFRCIARRRILKLDQQTITPQKYTILVRGFPNDYKTSEQDALNFFESKFGQVHEVVFAREWGKIIKRFRKRADLNKKIKLRQIQNKLYLEQDDKTDAKVKSNEQKLAKLEQKSSDYDLKLQKWYPE